jgi:hypothetical protein
MFRLTRKFVAVLLLLIISVTVLSPDFAWKATSSDLHGDAETSVLVAFDAHDINGSQLVVEQHDDHPCGCHMFSHLPIQASDSRSPFFPKLPDAFAFLVKSIHSSQDPDSLDRPPKSSLA